jgi:phage portal protein BeeE
MFYGGLQYPLMMPNLTIKGHHEDIGVGFASYTAGAYKSNGIVFACMLLRMMVFSEMRFQFRKFNKDRVPSDLWGDTRLAILEHPWPNATTGDLVSRASQDVDLAGNFYAVRDRNQIKRLRPDWVTIIVGSPNDPKVELGDVEAEVVGYLYHPGGYGSGKPAVPLLVEQVCHFAPIPDPVAAYRGMSWLQPILREVMSDSAATTHKLQFFNNGATVQCVVTLKDSMDENKFKNWIDIFEQGHKGVMNAYKTLYLTGGATMTPVGSDFKQLEFKTTQGAGETRIAAAAGTPPILVGLSEGLQAGTYNNYGQALRRFADGTARPWWRNFCGSMATLVDVPGDSELWYDDRDIAFLREDAKDAAEIQGKRASSIMTLVNAGFKPDAVVEAVTADDLGRLEGQHTGLYSVQLQPPGTNEPAPDDTADVEAAPVAPNGKAAAEPVPVKPAAK